MRYTLKKLIELYRTDPDSPHMSLQYGVRVRYERLLSRIVREHGDISLQKIRTRNLISWHKAWLGEGKVAIAHALVSRLRVVFRFGATMLEDKECRRLLDTLSDLRFEKPARRDEPMTLEQAKAVRAKAHARGWVFLAFAQALQYELLLGQKDVIGEWVPMSEPGESNCVRKGRKWLGGLRWSNINADLVLRCTVGKQERRIEVDLKTAPMVMEDLNAIFRGQDRPDFPDDGPIILNEINGQPYSAAEFRRKWRKVAKAAGVPADVVNRSSRPAGRYRGGGDRAEISQAVTMQMINQAVRARRRS